MALTYQDVYDSIKLALTERASGTKVQDTLHEAAEINILDYIEQLVTIVSGSNIRFASASAQAAVNCDLVWDTAFDNDVYGFVPWGYQSNGNPVAISFVSQEASKVVVKTLVDATIYAFAKPNAV